MRALSLIFAAFLFSGCFQQIAINSISNIMDNGFEVLNEEQDLDLAEKSIASNLKLLEAVLRSDPSNERILLLTSIGYTSYALGFAEDSDPARASTLYLRGRDFGLRLLGRNNTFARESMNRTLDGFERGLAALSKDDVPAAFWTAMGWGGYINLNLTDPSALADLPKVEALMMFVLRTDPTYFHAGAHFFLGTLNAMRPQMLGGKPEVARSHFEDALKINGGSFLLTYVYYARSYAVQTQNQELFEECLQKVESASLDVLPEARLSNAIAKKKAALLRERERDLF
jgi:tetratricopeptide (TPR) repeat protein